MEYFYYHMSEFSLHLLMCHFQFSPRTWLKCPENDSSQAVTSQSCYFSASWWCTLRGQNSLDFQFGVCIFFSAGFKSQQYCGTMHLAMNVYTLYFWGTKKNNPNPLHFITDLTFKGPHLLKIKCRWRPGPESWFTFTSATDFLRALIN